jgi:hypothetical protein
MTDFEAREILIRIVTTLGVLFLMPWLVMLLWNEVITTLFNAPVLTYWYSMGLYILTGWLIRGVKIQKDE